LGKQFWKAGAYADPSHDNDVPPSYINMQDIHRHYVRLEIEREEVRYWVTIGVKKVSGL